MSLVPLLLTTYLIQMENIFSRTKNLTTRATLLVAVSAAPFKMPFIMTLHVLPRLENTTRVISTWKMPGVIKLLKR